MKGKKIEWVCVYDSCYWNVIVYFIKILIWTSILLAFFTDETLLAHGEIKTMNEDEIFARCWISNAWVYCNWMCLHVLESFYGHMRLWNSFEWILVMETSILGCIEMTFDFLRSTKAVFDLNMTWQNDLSTQNSFLRLKYWNSDFEQRNKLKYCGKFLIRLKYRSLSMNILYHARMPSHSVTELPK